ncbi:ABC transporter permease [Agrobacterium tumefaciens]|jgi:peptide/nickel transport system permease protein|uniref:ABC transporter, membrane spanning protein (Oligopeptide) n=1 Tax=Agrobacterium fabrum (strain C58 / ATCC 33970) TaxID=176299 RepID=A9CLC0_AGRFC|nr:ABC transporter permease [Agrobacterium fabrum]KEY50029.1 ABC transporter permease [Agrobacterium tumefaciens]AAK90718.1 ABC transporter, membrane spanning protein (oligopeptide) [Agrobacterium fabrum str. C58]KJX90174.1 Glutathione transport system permease protein gsiC [Agrobacterium tumefaciens]NMV72970.1 ABC transporter permease [Agrobacterium fabrum]QQN14098.1 ABC transporter permease [Agrobacterium fabrum]
MKSGRKHPIQRMVAVRLGLGLFTLLFISLLIFLAVGLLPGDIAQQVLGQSATPETVAAFRRELGLDQPLSWRYLTWIGGILTGDFGHSLANGRPVAELLSARLGNTLFLAAYAAAIAIPLAVLLGLLAAMWRGTWFDRVINVMTLSAISFPEFFVAYILMFWLSVHMGWFPSVADPGAAPDLFDMLRRAFLPAITLVLVVTAHMMRMTRAAVLNVLAEPYVIMARLKGASRWRIITRHALPNALAPISNVIAINVAWLITGVVIVEVVFVYPGLGQLMVDSVTNRDMPVVQACALIFAAVYILLNLLADVLAIATNPRLLHPR